MKKLVISTVMLASLATYIPVHAAKQEVNVLTLTSCGVTKKAFIAELAKAYEQKSGVKINIGGGGATKGIRNVSAGKSDLGGACRYKIASIGIERQAKLEPVGWDALVVVNHPGNPVRNVSLDQLRKIYSGQITNWRQLGGHDKKINLYARVGKISGVGKAFRELAFGDPGYNFVGVDKYVKSSGPLEKGVAKDMYGIGVSGISSAKRREGVGIMQLDGVEPSYENIIRGHYKMYRPLYLAIHVDEERQVVKDFIAFAHTKQGRQIIKDAGTVPYLNALPLVINAVTERKDVRPYVSVSSR